MNTQPSLSSIKPSWYVATNPHSGIKTINQKQPNWLWHDSNLTSWNISWKQQRNSQSIYYISIEPSDRLRFPRKANAALKLYTFLSAAVESAKFAPGVLNFRFSWKIWMSFENLEIFILFHYIQIRWLVALVRLLWPGQQVTWAVLQCQEVWVK